jgi:hypothetical protein
VSDNNDHDDDPNNLYGSFNVADTVYNLIGSGNTIWDIDHDAAVLNGTLNDLDNDTPGLAALDWNGGLTRTHRLLNTSDAIDAGSDDLAIIPFTSTPLEHDQRGTNYERKFDVENVGNEEEDIVDLGAYELQPPRVLDVIVSSTKTTSYSNGPHSFIGVAGSEGQLVTVPVGAPNQISIQLSEPTDLASGDFPYIVVNRVVAIPAASFTAPDAENNFTATWTLSSSADQLPHGQYVIKVKGTVENLSGLQLDGDWTNPTTVTTSQTTSSFPSGNGTAGGDFAFVFTILQGDIPTPENPDGDNRVNGLDVTPFATAITNPSAYPDAVRMADINGDGNSNGLDVTPFVTLATAGIDYRVLKIIADLDGDFDVDADDWQAYQNNPIDLDGDNDVDDDDEAAFLALYNFGIDLLVAT